jgi:hypothetical protein
MLIALTPGSAWDHVLKADKDRPAAEQATFRIRVLKAAEFTQVMGLLRTGDPWTMWLGAIRHGLVGWKNIVDGEGRPLPFPDAAGPAVDYLPTAIFQEIAEAILEGSRFAEDDRGK